MLPSTPLLAAESMANALGIPVGHRTEYPAGTSRPAGSTIAMKGDMGFR